MGKKEEDQEIFKQEIIFSLNVVDLLNGAKNSNIKAVMRVLEEVMEDCEERKRIRQVILDQFNDYNRSAVSYFRNFMGQLEKSES
jgi:hypothetical protein